MLRCAPLLTPERYALILIKHNMKALLLWLLLTLLWTAAVSAEDALQAAHHGEDNACRLCHGDEVMPPPEDSEECAGCHAARREQPLKPQSGRPATAPRAADDSSLGLTLPMYSPASRLGETPNPMVRIPAGPFLMGSDSRLDDEGPQHTVTLPAYRIDRYEVTNLQYRHFIDDTGRRSPTHFRNRTFPDGKADHPVTFVSWYDARDYCQWAGKRLPTEQEWEKAARGSDGRIFPWGDEFDIRAGNTPVRWARLKEEGDTTPVGAFPLGRSPYGVEDMSGNVWEWTASWYLPHPGNTHQSENFGKIYKVLKGGSWWDCSYYKCGISAPTFNRSFFNPRVKNSSFGFRCAADVDKDS